MGRLPVVSGSVESGVTGEGGDGVIVDDPHNVHDADSERVRETTENWWFESMSTRLNDPDTGFHVAVFQRVHEKDIAAKCIERGVRPPESSGAVRSEAFMRDGSWLEGLAH